MKNIFLIILLSINLVVFGSDKNNKSRSRSPKKLCYCDEKNCKCYNTPIKNSTEWNSSSKKNLGHSSNNVKYLHRADKALLLFSSDKKNNTGNDLNVFALNHLKQNENVSSGESTPKKDDLFSEGFKKMSEKEKQNYLNQHPKFAYNFNTKQNTLNLNIKIGEFGDINLSKNFKNYNNNYNNNITKKELFKKLLFKNN